VTATQIKVAVTLTNVIGPATNSLFGVAQPEDQQHWYEAVFDDMNKTGGVGCRQCFAQHRIPYFGGFMLFRSEIDSFYPYLFNLSEFDTLEHNTIFGLKDRGFFNLPANEKLGFVYRDCNKTLVDKTLTWIQQAGVPSSKLVTYNFGCPSAFASPSDIQAAILKFQQNTVTHVTAHNFSGDYANFTNVAEQQRFRPKYGLPDESLIDISYGGQKPNYANIADAIMVAPGRSGEERTPGATPSPGTAKCDAIYQAHGLPPTYKLPPGAGYTRAAAAGRSSIRRSTPATRS
jgi:hypothetical protein